MANTTALSSLSSAQAQLLGTRTVAFTDESTGYVFSIDSDGDVVYAKTTNGGASFGSAVTVFSSIAAVQLTVWADWWTSGATSCRCGHGPSRRASCTSDATGVIRRATGWARSFSATRRWCVATRSVRSTRRSARRR